MSKLDTERLFDSIQLMPSPSRLCNVDMSKYLVWADIPTLLTDFDTRDGSLIQIGTRTDYRFYILQIVIDISGEKK